jgi:hypothetical protein
MLEVMAFWLSMFLLLGTVTFMAVITMKNVESSMSRLSFISLSCITLAVSYFLGRGVYVAVFSG